MLMEYVSYTAALERQNKQDLISTPGNLTSRESATEAGNFETLNSDAAVRRQARCSIGPRGTDISLLETRAESESMNQSWQVRKTESV